MAKSKQPASPKRAGARSAAGRKPAAAESAAAAKQGPVRKGAAAAGVPESKEPALPDARPPVGLQNLGNTCFFNSTLQVGRVLPGAAQLRMLCWSLRAKPSLQL